MRTVCFYSGKGGVGKTTHNELFSAWLAYHCKARVIVVDMTLPDGTILKDREAELRNAGNPDSVISRYLAKHPVGVEPYEIVRFDMKSLMASPDGVERIVDHAWDFVKEYQKDADYIIWDLDPVYMGGSIAFGLLSSDIMDLVVIPICVDNASFREGVLVADDLIKHGGNAVCFWNNISVADLKRRGFLEKPEGMVSGGGIEFLPVRIKQFAKAGRDSDTQLFVKSTLCWPERYVDIACRSLPFLYESIKSRVDSV